MTGPSPSDRVRKAREELGRRLREIRIDAGLTGRSLAATAGWDRTKVSKIEHGARPPNVTDIRAWTRLCGVPDQAADLIAAMRTTEEAYVEWRRLQRSGLRRLQASRLPLYERTRRFRVYEPGVIPGLLQTPGYVRAVMSKIVTFRNIPDDLDAAVPARIERQKVLRQGDHTFAFVLEESALWTRLGGAVVMSEQLARVLEVMSAPRVSVGVIPADADRQLWPVEGFWMFDDERVAVETVSAWITITQPAEIALYAETFEELTRHALFGHQARELITKVAGALR